jgi:hypothetical protein
MLLYNVIQFIHGLKLIKFKVIITAQRAPAAYALPKVGEVVTR